MEKIYTPVEGTELFLFFNDAEPVQYLHIVQQYPPLSSPFPLPHPPTTHVGSFFTAYMGKLLSETVKLFLPIFSLLSISEFYIYFSIVSLISPLQLKLS